MEEKEFVALVDELEELAGLVGFPGPTLIIALVNNHKPLRKIFERVQRSEIYRAV